MFNETGLREWELLALDQELGAMVDDSLREIIPPDPMGILEWVETNIDLSHDTTAATKRLILDHYQREPLVAIASDDCNELTVQAVEQTGKSALWQLYALYRLDREPGPMCVVYPNDEIASDTNRERLEPLMQGVPKLAAALTRPKTKRKDAYHFADATLHFLGAGAPILSRPFEIVVADEPDFWVGLTNDDAAAKQSNKAQANVGNLLNLKKRTRTYRERRKILKVCSPTLESGKIHREWKTGSRGRWHLSCLKCGKLIRSSRTSALQWELDATGEPVADSIRFVCPECGRLHKEAEAPAMNAAGRYLHDRPKMKDHRSFTWGALACPRAIRWLEIAQAQMVGGDGGTLEAQKYLDNSFRGLPLQVRRRKSVKLEDFTKTHARPLPKPEDLRAIMMAADTQDDGWFGVIRGIDDRGHTYGLRGAFCRNVDELEALYNWQYGDLVPMVGIIDEGGHRVKTVRALIKRTPGLYSYKGATTTAKDSDNGWIMSKNVDRLILANPYHFQEALLWLMHKCTDDELAEFWAIPEDLSDWHADYIAQLLSLKPNPRKMAGHEYRNWAPGRKEADHFFDAEKMWLVLLSYALEEVSLKCWRGGRLPLYWQAHLQRQIRANRKKGRR